MGYSDRRKRLSARSFSATITCSLLAISTLLLPMSAHAANRQAQERKAHKACLSGDYAKGVSILSDLFVDSDDPTYIFNQGRCFEQNRRYEDAIARFQEYLRAGTNTPLKSSDKALAEKHIADCQDLLTKQPGYIAPAAPSQPVQTPIAPPAPASPPPTTVPAPVMLQQVQQQPAGTPGSGLRTAGIVTASVGGAALIAGVILNLKVNSMASSMETTPGGYTPGKESNRKTYQTLGWVGYGAGAACIATGSVLYLLGLKSGPSDTASVAFVPAFAPGQTGAVLKGGF